MAEKKAETKGAAKKKLQIKDLAGKELSGRLSEQVKGGLPPKIICLTVRKLGKN